jgi:hypothetical protein
MPSLPVSKDCTRACESADTTGCHPRRDDHHDDATVLVLLDGPRNWLLLPQLGDRLIDVIAHQRDRVVTREVVGFAFPFAVSGVHAQLAGPDLKMSQSLSKSSVTYFHPRRRAETAALR